MTKLVRTLSLLSAAALLAPTLSRAQDTWTDEPAPAAGAPQPSQPAQPQPGEMPPAPPAETPPPPQAQAPEQAAPAAVPPGQWVYTQQYGWIWMPYADSYTSVPAGDSGAPYAYVFYPAYSCWTWVAAPWVWGWGPWPFFGVAGAVRFAWWGHGWWRYPSHWHYAAPVRGFAGPGFVPRGAGRGGWVAPSRSPAGFRAPAAAPGFRAPAAAPRGFAPYRAGAAPFPSGRVSPAPFSGGRAGGFSPGRVGGFSPGRVAAGGGHAAPMGGGRTGGHGGWGGGHGGGHGRRG